MKRDFLLIPEVVHLKESIALAETYGAAFEYNDFARPTVYEDPDEVARRIEIYRSAGRNLSADTMHGAFLDVIWNSPDSVIRRRGRELIEQSMETALKLGVRGIVFHTGLIAGLEIPDYLEPWLDESDRYWHEILKRYPGVNVFMENTFERSPKMLLELQKRMSDEKAFGLCLDYGHAILSGGPIEQWIGQMGPYVRHIHLNDNDGKCDMHLVPGEGKIDFNQCRHYLQEDLPGIPVLLELNGLDCQKRALEYVMQL